MVELLATVLRVSLHDKTHPEELFIFPEAGAQLGNTSMTDEKQYHIGIAPGEIPSRVLLPGDPGRAELIAQNFFDDPSEIARNREYWSFRGRYRGEDVAVCSTGIGCPSAAIAIEELVKVGCDTFIRVGTSGAIDPSLRAGDLVIFTGSVRDDGTSKQYAPVEFPALAHFEVVRALIDAAQSRGVSHQAGIGHSKDAFYSEYPDHLADPEQGKKRWETLRRANVLATEMEAATLFVVGHLRGVRVGTVCVIIGEPVGEEEAISGKPPVEQMTEVALDALVSLG
ncbi:nucleoside phosphorylase [Candidatus Thorarchaeota archaeon]|nr:MAG: nucleoside phosphorylase [Candidatus Thorarchaeota archaeon]